MISGNSGCFGLTAPDVLLPVFCLYKYIYKYIYNIDIRVYRVIYGYVVEYVYQSMGSGKNSTPQPELPEFSAAGAFLSGFCLYKSRQQLAGSSTRTKKRFARNPAAEVQK